MQRLPDPFNRNQRRVSLRVNELQAHSWKLISWTSPRLIIIISDRISTNRNQIAPARINFHGILLWWDNHPPIPSFLSCLWHLYVECGCDAVHACGWVLRDQYRQYTGSPDGTAVDTPPLWKTNILEYFLGKTDINVKLFSAFLFQIQSPGSRPFW